MNAGDPSGPSGLRYQPDEKPPALLVFGLGLQIAVLSLAAIIVVADDRDAGGQCGRGLSVMGGFCHRRDLRSDDDSAVTAHRGGSVPGIWL